MDLTCDLLCDLLLLRQKLQISLRNTLQVRFFLITAFTIMIFIIILSLFIITTLQ